MIPGSGKPLRGVFPRHRVLYISSWSLRILECFSGRLIDIKFGHIVGLSECVALSLPIRLLRLPSATLQV
jgi:hypothetical protein